MAKGYGVAVATTGLLDHMQIFCITVMKLAPHHSNQF